MAVVVVAATQPKLYRYPVVPVKYCRQPLGGRRALVHSIWVTLMFHSLEVEVSPELMMELMVLQEELESTYIC